MLKFYNKYCITNDTIEDIQCDLASWEQELSRLQAEEEEPDTEEIAECQAQITRFKQALLYLA